MGAGTRGGPGHAAPEGPDPEAQLERWLSEAEDAGETLPRAMALATTDGDGHPAVRMVIARRYGPGLVFFTDRGSDKGRELDHNPRAAALFHWHLPVHRQVRVSGPTSPVSEAEADRYWRRRTPAARRAAIASHQSRVIAGPDVVEQRMHELERLPGDDLARPDRWGGYRLQPRVVEFWQEGADQLHDRLRYRLDATGWHCERLSP